VWIKADNWVRALPKYKITNKTYLLDRYWEVGAMRNCPYYKKIDAR